MTLVYVDEREKNSKVPQILMAKGVTVVYKLLDVGDYVVNRVIGIERKTANDYINSLIDQRLINQLSRLREVYEKAILIVEGDISKAIRGRNLNRNSILGSYVHLVLDLGIQIIHTSDEEETAEVIKRISLHKLSAKFDTTIAPHKPKLRTLSDWQRYIVQCFPHIGPKIAQRILEHFGSINAFCNASPQELSRIEGLNEKKAGEIYQLIHALYEGFVKNKQPKVGIERQKNILDYVDKKI